MKPMYLNIFLNYFTKKQRSNDYLNKRNIGYGNTKYTFELPSQRITIKEETTASLGHAVNNITTNKDEITTFFLPQ